MADVYDNTEQRKKLIESIANNEQKCILSEPIPEGIYLWGNSTYPNFQQIDYVDTLYALLFKSSGRVCLLEKETDEGGKYWILKGNGNYTLTKNSILSQSFGIDVRNNFGVPDPPTNVDWSFTLENIDKWVLTGGNFNTIYNNIQNAPSGNINYYVSTYNLATKEFYKNADTITDNFKIGYLKEYALSNRTIYKNNSPDMGTVSKNYALWNFDSNTALYNKAVGQGCIELTKVNAKWLDRLGVNQTYLDKDIPLAGYHRFYNILVTSNEEQANEYINNGTIPDDARITDERGNEEKVQDDESESTENDGKKADYFIQTPENKHPAQSQLSAGTNFFYKLNTSELTSFMTWFWNDVDLSDILFNTVTGLYNNMAECVLSIKYYPLKPTSEDFFRYKSQGIVMGRFKTDENYTKITSCAGNGMLCEFDFSKYKKYSWYSNLGGKHNFTDFAPYTDIYIYLPFYGYHKLDTNMVQERGFSVHYSLDITTGALDYNIKLLSTTIETISCNFGIDVPYTLSSMLEMGTNIAKNVTDVAISAGTNMATNFQSSVVPAEDSKEKEVPKPSKGGSNLVGNSFTPPALNINGKISNGIGLYHYLTPFLIIKHPRYYRASNYGKIEGYPCMKAYKLSDLKGYTECERPQIQKFTSGTPTADEIGEILNILSNGIVIR